MASPAAWSQDTCSTLIATGHPDFPPVSWNSGTALEGYGPTLLRALAEQARLGVNIVDTGSWSKAQQAVMSGRADVIYGLYKTPERMQWLSYVSTPIFSDAWGVVAPKGKAFIYQNPDSLIGKRGVTTDAESFGAELDQLMQTKLTVRRVPNQRKVFDELKAAKIDYAIVSLTSPLNRAEIKRLQADVVVLSDNFLTTDMYIAVRRDSPCREAVLRFSSTIQAWKRDGKLEQMIQQARQRFEATVK